MKKRADMKESIYLYKKEKVNLWLKLLLIFAANSIIH